MMSNSPRAGCVRMLPLLSIIFSFTVWANKQAVDKGFRFKDGKCVNEQGQEGLNPSYFGQCGDLRGVRLEHFELVGLDLSGSDYSGSNLTDIHFENTIIDHVSFKAARISGSDFSDAIVREADFSESRLRNNAMSVKSFQNTSFESADLAESMLSYVRFEGVNLRGALLQRANLEEAVFSDCDLSGVDFTGAILNEANFTNIVLKDAVFSIASLVGTIFHRSLLIKAKMNGVDLTRADLREASLMESDLSGAILTEANFEKANLSLSHLMNADLSRTNLQQTILTAAKANKKTLFPFNDEERERRGVIMQLVKRVFVLWNQKERESYDIKSLVDFLTYKGLEVTLSSKAVEEFAGFSDQEVYDSVLLLYGFAPFVDIPLAGQQALVKFVEKGGTFLHTEWVVYATGFNYLQDMLDIITMQLNGYDTYSGKWSGVPVAGMENHSMIKDISEVNGEACLWSRLKLPYFFFSPSQALMKEKTTDNLFMAERLFWKGRAVGLNLTGNGVDNSCFESKEFQNLIFRAIEG